MERSTKVIGRKVQCTVEVSLCSVTGKFTWENSEMDFQMAAASVDGKMEISMKETIPTASNKAMASLSAQRKAGNIKASGSRAR